MCLSAARWAKDSAVRLLITVADVWVLEHVDLCLVQRVKVRVLERVLGLRVSKYAKAHARLFMYTTCPMQGKHAMHVCVAAQYPERALSGLYSPRYAWQDRTAASAGAGPHPRAPGWGTHGEGPEAATEASRACRVGTRV